MQYVLGADPGKHGGIALINSQADIKNITPADVVLIPTYADQGKVDVIRLAEALKPYAGQIVFAVQELVHAIFGMSAKSCFEFGDANGALRTLLQLVTNQQVYTIPPKTWQHVAWIPELIVAEPVLDKTTKQPKVLKSGKLQVKVDTKATSLATACKLFPGVSFIPPRCKKEHDGLIDAALIAYYGLSKYKKLKP